MKKDTLGLYGPEDSAYLRLVARRAKEEGVKTAWVAGPTPGCAAYVADTDAGWPLWDLSPDEDVDNIQHPGLSCCAAGILRCIYSTPQRWRACIIGRGHAVQGLAETLQGYEINQCSSTALDMAYRVSRADVIVNSAAAVTGEVLAAVPALATVIDISGSMGPWGGTAGCDYVPRYYVGKWNIAELLRRAEERIRKEREVDGQNEGRGADGV